MGIMKQYHPRLVYYSVFNPLKVNELLLNLGMRTRWVGCETGSISRHCPEKEKDAWGSEPRERRENTSNEY